MPEAINAQQVAALLNELPEAERAGARLLAAWTREASAQRMLHERLAGVQRDEARNCAILIHHLLEAGAMPSERTGDFYARALVLREWDERLSFLNRGQAWVARRIAAALPRLGPSPARDALQAMHDSHLANIARCELLLT